jgi:alanine racemase
MEDMTSRAATASVFDAAPARLTINLGAVTANWLTLRRLSGRARAAAVLKADAYGLGAEQVGTALLRAGCRDFFVATPDEGVRLRSILPEVRIYVLSGLWPGVEETIFNSDLIPVINSIEQLGVLMAICGDHRYALHIDTGMNRLGLTMEEAAEASRMPDRKPLLVMSHLTSPDHRDQSMNLRQLESFQQVARLFEGIESSLSSSAAIPLGDDFHFDLTRPGIGLFGGLDLEGPSARLLPVATAEARILQVRHVRKGETASYGATHTFDRDSRVATVAAGYADGWHRSMSGSGVPLRASVGAGAQGFVAGHIVPIIGRITMDLTLLDVSDIPEHLVAPGDYVEVFGEHISLTAAAHAAGTISYELLTSLGKRYARRYV